MKKLLIGLTALSAAVLMSIPIFAHGGRAHRAYHADQCENASVCMTDGVCNGACAGTGDCLNYDGCRFVPDEDANRSYDHHGYGHGCRNR